MTLTKMQRLGDPFIAAGDRAYLVGAQDGGFPPTGWHTPGEMGGVWTHPIKLLDGFWLQVGGTWVSSSSRFTVGPFWNAFEFSELDGLRLARQDFVPDGEPAIVVRFTLESARARTLSLRVLARTHLQAVWPGGVTDTSDTHDEAVYSPTLGAWICCREDTPWYALIGSGQIAPVGWDCGNPLTGPEPAHGSGVSVALDFRLPLRSDESIHLDLIITGSHLGLAPARESFQRVSRKPDVFWEAKAQRYDAMLQRSVLEVPDEPLTAAWDWLKCNYDWLIRDVPGTGRGLGAGVADYPWWFGCDSAYAVLGCLALGQHEVAVDTLDLLRTLSIRANGESGRVIHEGTTSGQVIHRGNTQETPHFVTAVWHTFLWTGDQAFLLRNYDFCKRGLLEWTLGTQCPDGDALPFGYGIHELAGLDLQCVDTAAHTVAALAALGRMAGVLGESAVAAHCRSVYTVALARLDEAFWMEAEGVYGDIVATPSEMVPRVRRWIEECSYTGSACPGYDSRLAELRNVLSQAESDPRPDRKRPWLCKSSTVVAPLEARLAPSHQAVRALERLESPEFSGPWGMYVSGLDRTQSMSITSGVLAVAELAYGRVEQGLHYVRLIAETLPLHMPGAISEIAPDGGCFVQAWSGYAIAWPVVTQIFGLRPDAHRKQLVLHPRFPASWQEARLSNVLIGSNSLDFAWDGRRVQVSSKERGWTITSDSAPTAIEDVNVRTS
jgi:hypothetical protein